MSTDENGATATPLKMLPVVLAAFEEAGKARVLPTAVDRVLADVLQEVEPLLEGEPEMDATDALRRALTEVRHSFARQMTKRGHLLSTRDDITRDAEKRIWLIAKSGPRGY